MIFIELTLKLRLYKADHICQRSMMFHPNFDTQVIVHIQWPGCFLKFPKNQVDPLSRTNSASRTILLGISPGASCHAISTAPCGFPLLYKNRPCKAAMLV